MISRPPGRAWWFGVVVALAIPMTALTIAPHAAASFTDSFAFKYVALALAAGTAAGLMASQTARPFARHEQALAALVGLALLSWAIHASARAFGLLPVAGAAAAGVVAVAVRIAVQERPCLRAHAVDLVIATAAVVAIVALVESLGAPVPWSDERRPESTLGNRNFVGAYVAVAVPLTLTRVIERWRSWRAAALVVIVGALVISRCRSAWLGAMVSAAIVLGFHMHAVGGDFRSPRLRRLVVAVALTGLGVAAASAIPWPGLRWAETSPFASTLERMGEYDKGSGKGRIDQHRIGWAILESSPLLGVGPHGWGDAASAHAHIVAEKHAAKWLTNEVPSSDLVRIVTETGALGLLTGLVALGLLARAVRAHARDHAEDRTDAIVLSTALLCVAIHGLFDSPLYRPETLGLTGVLVGMLPQGLPAGVRPVASATTGALVLVAGGSLVLAIAMTVSTVLRWPDTTDALLAAQRWYPRPDREQRLVARLGKDGRCAQALATLDVAMRWTPHVWGPLIAAERCVPEAEKAALHARALAIEPDVDALVARSSRPDGSTTPIEPAD